MDDFQALLQALAAPCPLQLHPYSADVESNMFSMKLNSLRIQPPLIAPGR